MANWKTIAVLLILTGAGNSLSGQDDTADRQLSRWVSSLSIGMDLKDYSKKSFDPAPVTGSSCISVDTYYRLHRRLDVGIQLGYQKLTGKELLTETLMIGSFKYLGQTWTSRQPNLFGGLQARLNHRMGQGDLAVSATAGLSRHLKVINAVTEFGEKEQLRANSLFSLYHQLRAGYTYWPRQDFGLELAVSWLSMYHSGSASADSPTRSYDYFDDNLQPVTITRSPQPVNTHNYYLTLAVVRRW